MKGRLFVVNRIFNRFFSKKKINKQKQFIRHLFPFPKIWAYFTGTCIPVSYITDRNAGLIRPESITFSSSGKLLGVCNSEGGSVSFFPHIDAKGVKYATKPSFLISNSACLNYVHDAVLSPCDNYLLTVARDGHTLSLFDQLGKTKNAKDNQPLWSFSGKKSALNSPTSVAIHPSGNCIAVANRQLSGITLYRSLEEKGHFNPVPFQTISDDDLFKFDLASPHGLDFSPDGNYLVVAHKRFLTRGDLGRAQSALSIFEYRHDPQLGLNSQPVVVKKYGNAELHSVSVHPSSRLIAVSDEGAGVDILSYKPEQGKMSHLESFPIFRIGSSIKGLGFTKDGKHFAVTSELNEVLFFETPSHHA